jgi:hypothetical protein
VTVRVSPEQPPFPTFTVYAFDAAGNRSPATTVRVNAFDAGESLFPVTHQWTTDEYQAVPAPATCGGTLLSVRCVPDTAGVDARHPNGARPLLLPAGVTWDGSGGGVPGVLTFGPASTAPAATVLPAVDLRQSFTAGAWLTPTGPTGVATTAVAQEGLLSGFELGLTADGHWQFRLHIPSTTATAVSAGTAGSGAPVYVSGVWDAVNKELRLYVGSGLASITRFDPHAAAGLDGGVTVGGRWAHGAPAELWSGQIGNPVVAQAAFTSTDVAQLAGETFFPNPNGDLG